MIRDGMLFCENCINFDYIRGKLETEYDLDKIKQQKIEFKTTTSKQKYFEILPESLSGNGLRFKCLECGSSEVCVIDIGISEIIIELNSLGYHTAYSCEGHDLRSNSYITFSNNTVHSNSLEPLSAEKRFNLHKAFTECIENEKYSSIYNKIRFKYDKYDYNKEEIIDKFLAEEDGVLTIDYLFMRGDADYCANETNAHFYADMYKNENNLFWMFICDIFEKLREYEEASLSLDIKSEY